MKQVTGALTLRRSLRRNRRRRDGQEEEGNDERRVQQARLIEWPLGDIEEDEEDEDEMRLEAAIDRVNDAIQSAWERMLEANPEENE